MREAPVTGPAVRRAGPPDRGALAALVAVAGLPVDGLDAAAVTFVADAGDRVVGVAALERHEDAAGPAYLLRSVVVAPELRGTGTGAALVAAALAVADAEGAPVGLLTETADGWFPRFGFTPVERAALPGALAASPELRGACPASARALLRRAR